MSFVKNTPLRWGIIILCMALGTWLGIFLQSFSATAAIFANFVDFTFDLREIDIAMIRFGILFGLKINIATIFGAVIGILVTR